MAETLRRMVGESSTIKIVFICLRERACCNDLADKRIVSCGFTLSLSILLSVARYPRGLTISFLSRVKSSHDWLYFICVNTKRMLFASGIADKFNCSDKVHHHTIKTKFSFCTNKPR